jgi:hypothetical protein
MGNLRVMDEKGHTEHTWDSPEESAVVEGVFRELQGRGYIAARMSPDGSSGDVIREFDASAGSILMMPLMRGG